MDLVNVEQNFFETYDNVLDFLNKNPNCPKCVKDNLNRLIKKKYNAGFSTNNYCIASCLVWKIIIITIITNCDAFNYSNDIEKRCNLGSVHIKSKSKIKAMEMVEIKIESSLS